MTQNQIRAREAREKERSNREQESIARRGQVTSMLGSIGSGAVKGLVAANDPSWYNLDPKLVKDVAQFSYNTPLGINTNTGLRVFDISNNTEINLANTSPLGASATSRSFPGAMALNYIPVFGCPDSEGNPDITLNIAMKNIYAFVRHANSGHTNYDSPDLMKYLIVMDSWYSWIAQLCRAYSIACEAKSANRYYPIGLLKALRFDVTSNKSILNNLADFRALINRLIQASQTLNVPAQMPLFQRHVWMNMNIFKDVPYTRSRVYLFRQAAFYKALAPKMYADYNEQHTITVDGSTYAYTILTGPFNMDTIKVISEAWINSLLQDEDIGIMSGDILKAYGEGGLFKFGEIEPDYHIESIYSEEVLSQINGATLPEAHCARPYLEEDSSGNLLTGSQISVTDVPEVCIYAGAPGSTGGIGSVITNGSSVSVTDLGVVPTVGVLVNAKAPINMYKDDVTPDDNMVATRLSYTDQYYDVIDSFALKRVTACGTEILTTAEFTCYDSGNCLAFRVTGAISTVHSNGHNSLGWEIDSVFRFERCPVIKVFNGFSGANATVRFLTSNIDLFNYRFMNAEDLRGMHSVALLSLLGVPRLGDKIRK